MVKRYTVNVASIAELYDVLPGEVINAQDYDAMAAKLQGTQDELYGVAKAAEQLGESLELAKAALAESERYEAQNHERIKTLEAALKRACELLEMWHEEHHPMVAGCCATKQFLERYQSETPAHCEHGATNPPDNCAICSGLETKAEDQ